MRRSSAVLLRSRSTPYQESFFFPQTTEAAGAPSRGLSINRTAAFLRKAQRARAQRVSECGLTGWWRAVSVNALSVRRASAPLKIHYRCASLPLCVFAV
jgi:hypothetical protein